MSKAAARPEALEKFAGRLRANRFSDDRGEILELSAGAFARSGVGERQVALVRALERERVILPIAPATWAQLGQSGEENCDSPKLYSYPGAGGEIAPIFVEAAAVEAYGDFRPLPMVSREAALASLASGVTCWEVHGPGGVIELGYPALNALALGDDWLAPWEDTELIAELRERAARHGCELEVHPGAAGSVEIVVWADAARPRPEIAAALQELAALPRLQTAAAAISFTPRPR